MVLPVPQRYNLKAIHNQHGNNEGSLEGVTSSSKIQFESNSQHTVVEHVNEVRCYQFLKDTI